MRYKYLLIILAVSLIVKLAYLFFGYLVIGENAVLSINGYADMLIRNDVGWYARIAENWYPVITDVRDLGWNEGAEFKQSEWAFFPFYPWINSVVMELFNIPFRYSALILSIVFSTIAFWGFYIFCEIYTGDKKLSLFCTLVFLLFPFHYYFSMMYTEAPFFIFLIFTFIAIHSRKYVFIPLLIIPLVLLRPFGIIALVPMYLYFLEREYILRGVRFDLKAAVSKVTIARSMYFITGPLAFLFYCLYQERMTGEYLAFSIAQAGWYKEFMFPLLALFRHGDFSTQFNSIYTIAVIIFSIYNWKKLPLSLNVFIWFSLILPLVSGSVASMPRYISVIFPLTIIAGHWLYGLKLKNAVLVIIGLLQLVLFYYWITGHPFSF